MIEMLIPFVWNAFEPEIDSAERGLVYFELHLVGVAPVKFEDAVALLLPLYTIVPHEDLGHEEFGLI